MLFDRDKILTIKFQEYPIKFIFYRARYSNSDKSIYDGKHMKSHFIIQIIVSKNSDSAVLK